MTGSPTTSGWAGCPTGDPRRVSRLRTRLRALWHAIFLGPDAFLATIRMQRAATELAYLRDAMTRGLVDDAGLVREKTLLGPAARPTRIGDRATRRAGGLSRRFRRTKRASDPRTRRRAIPDRPASAATTRPRAPRLRCRWGRLLPSIRRSIPAGSLPASRRRADGQHLDRVERRSDAVAGSSHRAARGGRPDSPAAPAARRRRAATAPYPRSPPAGRLRAAPARHHRRATARRGRRVDRRRQVDPGQLAGRAPGDQHRGDPADHPSSGAGPPQRRCALVRRRPDPARTGPVQRIDERLAVPAPGGRRLDSAGAGHPRRARHRLGGRGEPAARGPAAGRRRPVAVRHLGGALRRRGAVGVPAGGGRAQRRGGGGAGPRAAAGDVRGPAAPGPDDERARAGRLAAVRGPRDRRRRPGAAAGCGGAADPRLAGRAGPRPGQPGGGGLPDARRRDRFAGGPGAVAAARWTSNSR